VIAYLQYWGTKAKEKAGLDKMVDSMKRWLHDFKPRRDAVSDIGVV
jgi:hypothetical protein